MILLAFVSAAILIFGAECNSAQAMKRGASGFDTDEECVELAKKRLIGKMSVQLIL